MILEISSSGILFPLCNLLFTKMWCYKGVVSIINNGFITDNEINQMCNWSNVFPVFFSSLINPLFRFQPMFADCPREGGTGDYNDSNSFLTLQKQHGCQDWKVVSSMCLILKTLTLYQTLGLQSAGGPCQVIVNMWETHHQPRTMSPTGIEQQKNTGWVWEKYVRLKPPFSHSLP